MNGGSHHLFKREVPELLFGVDESRDRAGHADCLVSEQARVFDHVALSVEIHVLSSRGGRFFAKVDEVDFAIRLP